MVMVVVMMMKNEKYSVLDRVGSKDVLIYLVKTYFLTGNTKTRC